MARRLKAIAAWINANLPELEARIERGHCNTDFKPKGLRYITRKGKGRWGNRLKVYRRSDFKTGQFGVRTIFDHNAAETYRSNDEVERWLARYIERCRAGGKHDFEGSVCRTCRLNKQF